MGNFFFPDKYGRIIGTADSDTFTWSAYWSENITVKAGKGNDSLNFKLSRYKNKLYGQKGKDSIYGGYNNDTIKGGDANDKLYGYDGNDKIYGENGTDIIYGGNGTDYISGGEDNDKLYGQAGKDSIYGNNGNDYIIGGNSNDRLFGQNGKDTIYGESGDDYISGGTSNDKLYGGTGKDTIRGGTGNDYITGDDSDDSLYGDGGNDSVYGGKGNDTIYAGSGDDYINSGAGNDIIYCQSGINTVNCYSGDDIIYAGSDYDKINAGTGTNFIIFTSKSGNAQITNSNGIDNIKFDSNANITYKIDNTNLILTYNNGKTVTVKDYTSKYNNINIYTGTKKYDIEGYTTTQDTSVKLLIGKSVTFNVASGEGKTLILQNAFTNKTYTYTISSVSGTQSASFQYLRNGRLVITSDYINVTSGTNQADDIILLGSYNKINTGDDNDIIRVGYALDSDGYYLKESSRNTINSGSGNDYITLYGFRSSIDTGTGTDKICYTGSDSTYSATIENCEYTRPEFANISGETADYKVGWFSQGTGGGDCRLLSLIQSMSRNVSLSNYVSITSVSAGYNVSFLNYKKSPNNSVTITNSELSSFTNSYGDTDVVLIDCAINKLLAVNKDYGKTTVDTAYYNSFSEYMFGTTNTTYITVTSSNISKIGELWNLYKTGTITNFTLGISSSSENTSLGIIGGHAYAIKDYTDNHISLINVWDNADILNLDIDTLKSLKTYAIVYGYGSSTLLGQGAVGAETSNNNFELAELQQDIANWACTDCSVDAAICNSLSSENTNLISFAASDVLNYDVLSK